MKELFCTPEFWLKIWGSTDPQWNGLKKEMKFDLKYGSWKNIEELAQWYAEIFKISCVFDLATGLEDFIGIEKEVKALLQELERRP